MTLGRRDVRLSRTISHALRHEPWLYELELDDEGWVALAALLTALRGQEGEWREVSVQDVERIIATSDKRRFELRDGRIRAFYGHSTPQKLKKRSAVPPAVLFHGTSPAAAEVILTGGLLPMTRQYVHLSVDQETASQVGRRKAEQPVILRVAAGEADAAGVPFYEGNEKVWLADHVPAAFVEHS